MFSVRAVLAPAESDGSRVRQSGKTMSQAKDQGAFQRLMSNLVAHMYSGTPNSDQSERALRAVSGRLGRNPPYVEATFDLASDPSEDVLDVAISPKGKIAIVLGIQTKEPFSRTSRLVVYTSRKGIEERQLGIFKGSMFQKVLFPEGSEEPAVVIGGEQLFWGNWTVRLPWKDASAVPESACLTLWGPEGSHRTRHIAYLTEDQKLTELLKFGSSDRESSNFNPARMRWIGLTNGRLVQIEVAKGRDTFHCGPINIPIPDECKILESSIGFAKGGYQFVVNDSYDQKHIAYWSDGNVALTATCPDGNVHADHEQIFVSQFSGGENGMLMRFVKGTFEPIGDYTDLWPKLTESSRVFQFGSTAVVSEFRFSKVANKRRVLVVTPGHGSSAPNTERDIGINRFHHGIGLHRKDHNMELTLHWQIPTAADIGTKYADFPLYGTLFTRLTAVEDDRGKAIMSWEETDETFHVLRYPLPPTRK